MADGFASLGEMLTGGDSIAKQNAFYKGQMNHATVDHLSAQTQAAMEQARLTQASAKIKQDEAEQRVGLGDAYLKLGIAKTPEQADALAAFNRSGMGNFPQVVEGLGGAQTQGFRSTVADPNATLADRLGASSGIQGKPVSPYVAVPAESVNAFDPAVGNGAPTVYQTPTAQAKTLKDNAAATQPKVPKFPVGFEADPAAPGQLRPIKGGPADPDFKNMGSREATFFNRVIGGANQAVADIKNIVELPAGANSGVFGVGATPGTSLMASAKGALTNKLASQDVQDYNSILPGIERNLASIETAGLVPSNTFTGAFKTLELRVGDTEYTKLGKLAQMRQIVERGLEPSLSNPRVPKEQRDMVKRIVDEIQRVVPFTRNEVTLLQRGQQVNPALTLNDLIKSKGFGPSPTAAAPASGPMSFKTEAEAEAAGVKPGTKVVIGGVSGTWQ